MVVAKYITITYNFRARRLPAHVDHHFVIPMPFRFVFPFAQLCTWLHHFVPLPVTLSRRERLRSCIGAFVGIAFVGCIMRAMPGEVAHAPLLVAPMGASAVLLFAVPASPLAQPWSLIGGNFVAATVGVACARWIGDPVFAAAAAIAVAIAGMFAFRCVHPPSGAVALTAVIGGPAIHALGFHFIVVPILLQSMALLGAALVYHALTGHRYPHGNALAKPGAQHGGPPQPVAMDFTRADLEEALRRRDEWLDIAPDDLEALVQDAEMHAYARTFDTLSAADVMTCPALSVRPEAPASAALALLNRHRIKALPVVDASSRVVGIVTRADLAAHGRPRWRGAIQPASAREIRSLMATHVETVRTTTPIAALVPLFADRGHHHIPVVDADHRLAGIVTQSDLIAGLYRQTRMQRVA
ncbi:Probable transmembrane protein [Burkholderia singularis]|uniref:Probable transmembrane protein n=2 Tax=Burkholderia singularis TaxID=1503053 RepID=A0A238H308_9BURK|nr:Probable transmembrane protein [Burkholderia singularis]